MAFVIGLAAVLAAWNNVVNLLPGFATWYVPVNLTLAVALIALARLRGMPWDALGLAPARLASGARWGGAAFAVVAVAVAAAALLAPARLSDVRVDALRAGGLTFVALVRIPLGTVVLEEVAFRGVLLGAWARARSVPAGLLGQAAVFGLWHLTPTWIALEANAVATSPLARAGALLAAVLVTAGAGVVLGLLRTRSGSVLAPALAHTATNSLASSAVVLAH